MTTTTPTPEQIENALSHVERVYRPNGIVSSIGEMNAVILADEVYRLRAELSTLKAAGPREYAEDEINVAPEGWYTVRLHEDDCVDGMLVSENEWMECLTLKEAIRAAEFPSFVSAFGPIPQPTAPVKGVEE
jgi:hypothetical protein